MFPVVLPVSKPLAWTSRGERQVDWAITQFGLFEQSGSAQSMRPSRSSSAPLLHCSGPGGQLAAKRQPESAQSMAPSQSSSAPLSQISTVQFWQAIDPVQSASAQSTAPSQSLSRPSVHTSGPPVQGHAPPATHSGSAQS